MATTSTTPATTTDRHTVVGVFDGPNHAEQALTGLRDAGFAPEQVSVVAKEGAETQRLLGNTGMGHEGEAAGKGALGGAVLGGVAGWLLGISALVIPGIGPIVGAGILAATLAGAGIGAAAGGLVGALSAHGVPEDDARGYEGQVRKGSVLLTVHATGGRQAEQARAVFARAGGTDARTYRAPAQ
jgi:hypothetical protein